MQQKLVALKYSAIPRFLRAGGFYRNLSPDDPEHIVEIPEECFLGTCVKPTSLDELAQLLRVTMYWMLDRVPLVVFETWFRWIDKPVLEEVSQQVSCPELVSLLNEAVKVSKAGNMSEVLARSHRLEVILYVVPHLSKDGDATAIAAKVGHLILLKYLHNVCFSWHKDTCREAAAGGHLDCLRFAHENDCPWGSNTVTGAVKNNHLECLEYALTQGCRRKEAACDLAAKFGHLNALIMLRAHGVRCTAVTSFHAARCAETTYLQYLHENGCPWNERTPLRSVSNDSVNTLRYALEHGCPCNEAKLLRAAVKRGSLACITYLVEERHCFVTDQELFMLALFAGSIECMVYLINHGCPCATARFRFSNEEIVELPKVIKSENFMRCVDYAMEHGWKMNPRFTAFIRHVVLNANGTMNGDDHVYLLHSLGMSY